MKPGDLLRSKNPTVYMFIRFDDLQEIQPVQTQGPFVLLGFSNFADMDCVTVLAAQGIGFIVTSRVELA